MPDQSRWKGFLPAAVSAFLFSTSPVVVRSIFAAQEIDVLALLFLRFMIGATLLWVLPRDEESIFPSRGEWPWFLLAVGGITGTSIGTFFALRSAPAAMVTLLLYTYPVYTNIFAWIWFKESMSPRRVAALLTTLLGAATILGLSSTLDNRSIPGLIIAASCGLCYSFFSLASQQMMRKHGRSSNWICRWAVTGTTLVLFFLRPPTVWFTSGAGSAGGSAFLFWGIYLGVGATFFGYSLYLKAVQAVGAAQAGLYSILEPFFTTVLAWLYLGETLTSIQLTGAALLFFGIFGLEGLSANRMK